MILDHLMSCFEEWFWEKSHFLIGAAFWEQGLLGAIDDAHNCIRYGINNMAPVACRIAIDTALTEALSTCIIIAKTKNNRRFASGALGFTSSKRFGASNLYWNDLSSLARRQGLIDTTIEDRLQFVRFYGNEQAHVFAEEMRILWSESDQKVLGRLVLSNTDVMEIFAVTLHLIVRILERWLVAKTWAYRRLFSGNLRASWAKRMGLLPCGCTMFDATNRLKQRNIQYDSWNLDAVEACHVRPVAAYRLAQTREAYQRIRSAETNVTSI
jgi:hypothetical protein